MHFISLDHGDFAASAGVWLRANESEISAAPWAKWLGKDFAFFRSWRWVSFCVMTYLIDRLTKLLTNRVFFR